MNINLCLKHGFSLDAVFNATVNTCCMTFNMWWMGDFNIIGTDWLNNLKQLTDLGHEESKWLYTILSQNHPKDYSDAFLSCERTGRSLYYAYRFSSNIELLEHYLQQSAQLGYPKAIVPAARNLYRIPELVQDIDNLTIPASHMVILYARHIVKDDEPVLRFLEQTAAKEGYVKAMISLASNAYDRKQYDQCMQWVFYAAIFGYSGGPPLISALLSDGHEYLVGKYMWFGMKDTYFVAVLDLNLHERLEQAELQFIVQKTAAQRSIFTWMWISRLWGIPRDVALIIACKIWEKRIEIHG